MSQIPATVDLTIPENAEKVRVMKEGAEKLFAETDTNGDGFIDRVEFDNKALYMKYPEVAEVFVMMDISGDG